MAEPTTTLGSLTTAANILRRLPPVLVFGLTLGGYALIYLPGFGGVNPDSFKQSYGPCIWALTVIFTAISAVQIIAYGINEYRDYLFKRPRQTIKIFAKRSDAKWTVRQAPEGDEVTLISLDVDIVNSGSGNIRFMRTAILKPNVDDRIIKSDLNLPDPSYMGRGSPLHSTDHLVLAHRSSTGKIIALVRGRLAQSGKKLKVVLGITDHKGKVHKLKASLLPSEKQTIKTK